MFNITPYRRRELEKARNFGSMLDDFFGDDFLGDFFENSDTFKTDIKENENSYEIHAEVPGVKKEDIKLKVDDGVLTILAERKQEDEKKDENYVRREMKYGSFKRCFRLENVDSDNIEAKHDNGILKIKLPKLVEDKAKSKEIEIK